MSVIYVDKMDTFLEVLKWMGIALAAGFVGYFGRYPAKLLFDKITGVKKNTLEKPSDERAGDSEMEELKIQQKIEKKKAKQAAKMAKKLDEK